MTWRRWWTDRARRRSASAVPPAPATGGPDTSAHRGPDLSLVKALAAGWTDTTTIVVDVEGRATYVSSAVEHMTGRPVEAFQGRTATSLIEENVYPDDASALRAQVALLSAEPDRPRTISFRVKHLDGALHTIEGVGQHLTAAGAVGATLLNLRDVSERVALEQALTHQAYYDQLTGLPNRRKLRELLEQAMACAGANQQGRRVTLMLADLNQFKVINDTLGHHYGDMLLIQVADRLRGQLRSTDTVARLGGDEFAVLLPRISGLGEALSVASRLHATLEEPFTLEDMSVEVNASIGLAMHPDHATNPDELMRMADIAMYSAKAGHGGYRVFEPRLDTNSARKLTLLGQIRPGIAEGQMELFYQPQVDAGSGRLVGAEALVRWRHPTYGLLPPGEFVPLAEATGLIRPLTCHVLKLALRQQRAWQVAGVELCVAVNLSAKCLLDTGLPDWIERLLHDAYVPPRLLTLEITESAIMSDPARALKILRRLEQLGVRLSIDDFGTGYSSMARLNDLPVHELKIDRSFVTAMRDSQSQLSIVRSIITLGHNLGLDVVGEGVEDEETQTELKLLGCTIVQGYHIARPMPADQLPQWLATRPEQVVSDDALESLI